MADSPSTETAPALPSSSLIVADHAVFKGFVDEHTVICRTDTKQYAIWSTPDLSRFCVELPAPRRRGSTVTLTPTTDTPSVRCSTYASTVPLLVIGESSYICEVDDTQVLIEPPLVGAPFGVYPIIPLDLLNAAPLDAFKAIYHVTYQLSNEDLNTQACLLDASITECEELLARLRDQRTTTKIKIESLRPVMRAANADLVAALGSTAQVDESYRRRYQAIHDQIRDIISPVAK